jgi:mono/diheme cytochrome c family protein
MRTLAAIIVFAVLLAAAAVGVIYSGIYDVAATSTHGGLVDWAVATTMDRSVERHARAIEVPDLSAEMRLAGATDFNEMCAGCHTPPGAEPTPLAQGLEPPAPDLGEAVQELSPAEVFWIVKNGVRMTGMPAWGVTHDDEELWAIVAFAQELPGLDGAEYRERVEAGEGHGRHAHEAEEDHHEGEESGAVNETDEHEGEEGAAQPQLERPDEETRAPEGEAR